MQTAPPPAYPPSSLERRAPQSFYVLSCWNIPSQYSEARWHRELLSKPLAPVPYSSRDNRQAATPAAAATQGRDSAQDLQDDPEHPFVIKEAPLLWLSPTLMWHKGLGCCPWGKISLVVSDAQQSGSQSWEGGWAVRTIPSLQVNT